MNCEQARDRLQARIEGTLPAPETDAVERHLAACSRCREIALTTSILARTSGSTCDQARDLLGQRTEEALDPLDDELLDAHVDTCSPCARLATALIRLGEDLPALDTLAPDARFVDDVLDATSRKSARWRQAAARASEVWQGLLERPRLAWEAGYVGAGVLWVVFSLSGSPLPAQALESARVNPVEALEDASRPLSEVGHRTWVAASAKGLESIREIEARLSARYERSGDAIDDLRRHGADLERAAGRLDLPAGSRAFAQMATDAGTILQRFLFSSDTDNSRSPS